jgi:hypothetical protein
MSSEPASLENREPVSLQWATKRAQLPSLFVTPPKSARRTLDRQSRSALNPIRRLEGGGSALMDSISSTSRLMIEERAWWSGRGTECREKQTRERTDGGSGDDIFFRRKTRPGHGSTRHRLQEVRVIIGADDLRDSLANSGQPD